MIKLLYSYRVEQMDGGFFERYGSGFKNNFEEDTIIAEKDKYATLNEREISKVDNDIAERTQLSYKELLSSLLELNASIFFFSYTYLKKPNLTNCFCFVAYSKTSYYFPGEIIWIG